MTLSRTAMLVTVASLAIAGAAAPTLAQMQMREQTVTVGGAPMYPSKNIIQNAVNSKDHTTLVAAVKAAGFPRTKDIDKYWLHRHPWPLAGLDAQTVAVEPMPRLVVTATVSEALTRVEELLIERRRLLDEYETTDLAGMRVKDALTKLPADERQACQKLWADVAELLKKAGD